MGTGRREQEHCTLDKSWKDNTRFNTLDEWCAAYGPKFVKRPQQATKQKGSQALASCSVVARRRRAYYTTADISFSKDDTNVIVIANKDSRAADVPAGSIALYAGFERITVKGKKDATIRMVCPTFIIGCHRCAVKDVRLIAQFSESTQ